MSSSEEPAHNVLSTAKTLPPAQSLRQKDVLLEDTDGCPCCYSGISQDSISLKNQRIQYSRDILLSFKSAALESPEGKKATQGLQQKLNAITSSSPKS